jgi:hypothetical protein
MIIPFKPGQYSQDEYVICPRAPATAAELRDRRLLRAKVTKESYAYRLVNDLKADYEAYFACEYGSFKEYLQRRARLPAEVTAELTKALDESSGIYHFRPEDAFLTDAYGLEFLTRLLEDPSAGEAP